MQKGELNMKNDDPEVVQVYDDEDADTIIWYDLDDEQHVTVKEDE